jgi:Ca-activated chloride channel family protein
MFRGATRRGAAASAAALAALAAVLAAAPTSGRLVSAAEAQTRPGTAPAAPEGPPRYRVRLLSPAEGSFLSGRARLEAEASFPSDDPVARVDFFVDDVRVGSALRPPYRVDWDAGPEFLPRRVRAVAISASGERAAHEVVTRRLVPDQQDRVEVVMVYATVREKGRGYLTNLLRDDFIVEENGVPQKISYFSRQARPVSWVILLDVSASMQEEARIEAARRAARIFVETLDPSDRAMVITFNDRIASTSFSAGERSALIDAIEQARAEGGTALYDALVEAAARLAEVQGKKAILLLSDGRDQGMDGYGPGSTHTFEDALEQVRRSEVAVYAVGLGEDLDRQLDFRRRRSLEEILTTLSAESGGRAHMVKRAAGLREVFGRIAEEVRLQYSLGYAPSDSRRDGSWRSITVRTRRPQTEVTARKGYYAPRPDF